MDPHPTGQYRSLYRNTVSQLRALFLQLDCEEWDQVLLVVSIVSFRGVVAGTSDGLVEALQQDVEGEGMVDHRVQTVVAAAEDHQDQLREQDVEGEGMVDRRIRKVVAAAEDHQDQLRE
jgi:hypothetical protein